jgi:hypothetical protein
MTHRNDLQSLRTIAKRLARMSRIAHHEALDLISKQLGQAHWNALTTAWQKGWRPDSGMLEELITPKESADADVMAIPVVGIGLGAEDHGTINGHPYALEIDFEVLMGGNGWSILLEHAPSEKPQIEVYDDSDDNPILDLEFRAKALAICYEAAERLRARISVDWPRRSTMPDADGQAQHPLFKGVASKWYCLHCDAESSGPQMAGNMWHCPKCNATPIDMFVEPFWRTPRGTDRG